MSARSAVALREGADEELFAAIDEPGRRSLSERQRAALELADRFLTAPGPPDAELRAALRRNLSGAEVVELLLRLAHYSSNRIRVALGLDNEHASPRLLEAPAGETGAGPAGFSAPT